MYIEDLRGNNKEIHPFSEFSRGTVLYKKIDPASVFIKTDMTEEGNAVYLDNGELLWVDNGVPCCKVNYKFTLED